MLVSVQRKRSNVAVVHGTSSRFFVCGTLLYNTYVRRSCCAFPFLLFTIHACLLVVGVVWFQDCESRGRCRCGCSMTIVGYEGCDREKHSDIKLCILPWLRLPGLLLVVIYFNFPELIQLGKRSNHRREKVCASHAVWHLEKKKEREGEKTSYSLVLRDNADKLIPTILTGISLRMYNSRSVNNSMRRNN